MLKQILYSLSFFMILGVSIGCQNTSPANEAVENEVKDENLKETQIAKVSDSEYICPMQCEGSALNEPGTCPVCNMLLVRSVEFKDFDKGAKEHSRGSVYNLESDWVTQDGRKIKLENLSDNYQLVCMIFTACPQACPNLIGDMVSIDEALAPETRKELRHLLVTIDPENDTPERLATFAKSLDLNSERWTLLHGEKNNIQQLADMLGVEYMQYENGAFGHTNYLLLLNKNGEIVYRQNGINIPNEDMVAFMNEHI